MLSTETDRYSGDKCFDVLTKQSSQVRMRFQFVYFDDGT